MCVQISSYFVYITGSIQVKGWSNYAKMAITLAYDARDMMLYS